MLDIDAAITRVEQEGANARSAKRQEGRTPEARAKRNRGRAQRGRGYRAEKRIEARLEHLGFHRVPLSGAAGGSWSGDLRAEDGPVRVVEVKHRESDWPVLRRWLAQGHADALILDAGAAKEPLVVVTLETLIRLLEEVRQ